MKLSSMGIRNLKSFGSEKQMIDLKPINILVGKNSSGKVALYVHSHYLDSQWK